ncbi:unnamed protein product [Vitrella brassicaformis CCMP3155]|uniref:CAP-Gly domain-containing protein n=1 Tax=Vitrella brassicaformis (strain CCMP3155) TaxID=1169540 RepID=A0A0G4GSF8_VITBC|nr:unnamed protein product [Vitrella brassicaformis CCMP3155]|eukprot:CEM33406.1 unnamed protein product [Vitrella brassicaformis CCMP3155]
MADSLQRPLGGCALVPLDITHSNFENHRWAEIRLDPEHTIEQIKERLYRMVGTPPASMKLTLQHPTGEFEIPLDDDSAQLKRYGIEPGLVLHIDDTDPNSLSKGGGLEHTEMVAKYTMSDEDYAKRSGTMREFKARMQAARPELFSQGDASSEEPAESLEQLKQDYPVDSRCEVQPGGRRGRVAYVGQVEGGTGNYIGVELDEPQGKNDGTKNGKRYFDCRPNYGCFVRRDKVAVGDFPPIDPFDLEEL